MTAQAYFIINEDQKNTLADLAGDGHAPDAKLIDHPFAGNMGTSFDGLYALPASIVNENGADDLLPLLANAQVHILDDALLFAPQKAEEHVETEEPKEMTPVLEPTHIDPPAPIVDTAPIALPADTEAHD